MGFECSALRSERPGVPLVEPFAYAPLGKLGKPPHSDCGVSGFDSRVGY